MQRSPVGTTPSLGPGTARPVAEPVARRHHLADDLARGEVAHQALRAGMAKRAVERAADLAGDAQRAAFAIGDVDAFHLVRALALHFARQPQQPFARAVDRDLLGHHLRPFQRVMRGERGAQVLRHAGHGVEGGGAAEIEPVPELLHPHLALAFRHAEPAERIGEGRARKADQRRLCRRHIALERRLFEERRGRTDICNGHGCTDDNIGRQRAICTPPPPCRARRRRPSGNRCRWSWCRARIR